MQQYAQFNRLVSTTKYTDDSGGHHQRVAPRRPVLSRFPSFLTAAQAIGQPFPLF
jgi:hypothetical protein